MTTLTDTPHSEQLAEPGQRGSLQVSERVVVAIARAAAMEVTGVATPTQNKSASKAAGGVSGITSQIGDQLTSAVGRTLPRASAQVAGDRARLSVEIALLWPHSAATVAAAVREHVAARLREYAATTTDTVAVTISTVVRDQRTTTTRRVQ
ncbi:Asp23/Gls24 family envelope stress response protein [Quadrisphaera sp. RL12-1S]|uniref:Asp23/Gls24 family envelope stress response protein n=1 Tax=Quadrisphaera sp. RL12-1S TaxID=2763011 RepID=UPI00164663DC|nr:Asp23/Gls24 family envelope stress response protein [Quadrisphaera sp. RL12-1S]MBC3760106.1 Asp23/Gls24 family envelope stress response protein [Quadrisphaera sp. RL12-1S]